MTALPIGAIVIADRHRKDLGDIKALAESIRERGLLHPVVVTAEHRLVAGQRRLEACRYLGMDEVPVTVVANLNTAAALLAAERDENACRKDMTFSEMLPIKVALEALERPKAEERRVETQGRPKTGSNLEPVSKPTEPKTRDVVAKALGKSASTMDKVEEVHRVAAAPETSEPVREVAKTAIEQMDTTGKVDPAYKSVKLAAQSQAVNDFLGSDVDFQRAQLLERYFAAVARMGKDLLTFDPVSLGNAFDDMGWESIDRTWLRLEEWFTAVRKQRPSPGLHVVQGGK